MSAALALAEAGYCGLFGLLGLLMRRSLLVGVAYIFLLEGCWPVWTRWPAA